MHKIMLILVVLLSACTIPVQSQQSTLTLAEIIKRHRLSFGDPRKFNKITTMKLTGTAASFGEEYSVVIIRKRPNLCMMEVQREEGKDICVFNGKKIWKRTEEGEKLQIPWQICSRTYP